ncbi:hypothetical protein BH18CHL2_BH18CHL2_10830 [soil metagenome]
MIRLLLVLAITVAPACTSATLGGPGATTSDPPAMVAERDLSVEVPELI